VNQGKVLSGARQVCRLNSLDMQSCQAGKVNHLERKMRMVKKITKNKMLIFMLTMIISMGVAACGSKDSNNSTKEEETKTESTSADENKDGEIHHAKIEMEEYGDIELELDASAAPETVANFISLAESGFYDGLTFHRIYSGFMIQGGDPEGNGTGGSEKTIKGEFSANGVDNPISHTRGVISMARSNEYDSASSQFFIVHEDSTFLDGEYAAFGKVTSGIEVVDQICEDAKPIDDNGTISPEEQPIIKAITIMD